MDQINQPDSAEGAAAQSGDDLMPHLMEEEVFATWDPSYLPKLFSGKPGEDFEQWCKKLELVIETYSQGAPTLSQALGSCLSDDAFDYWDQLPLHVKRDFHGSKAKLSKVFGKATQNRKIRDFSFSRPRQPGESLELYLATLSKMVNNAFSGDYDYGEMFKKNEIKRRFIEGLSPSLRMKCLEQGPETLEKTLEIAKRLEFAELSSSQANTLSSGNVCNIQQDDGCSQNTGIMQLTNMVATLSSKLDNMEMKYRYSQDDRSRDRFRRRYDSQSPRRYSHSPDFFHSRGSSSTQNRNQGRSVRFCERGRPKERDEYHSRNSSSTSPRRFRDKGSPNTFFRDRDYEFDRQRYQKSREYRYCESCANRIQTRSPSPRRSSVSPRRHNSVYEASNSGDRKENMGALNMKGSMMVSDQRPVKSNMRK